MRVVCIDSRPHVKEHPHYPPIVEGDSYHISREAIGEYIDGEQVTGWVLMEIPGWVYEKWRFIPASEIDETTFERNYQTQPA